MSDDVEAILDGHMPIYCPFCENLPRLGWSRKFRQYRVECNWCMARGPSSTSSDVAVRQWNKAARAYRVCERDE
jgi:hypothetical protein